MTGSIRIARPSLSDTVKGVIALVAAMILGLCGCSSSTSSASDTHHMKPVVTTTVSGAQMCDFFRMGSVNRLLASENDPMTIPAMPNKPYPNGNVCNYSWGYGEHLSLTGQIDATWQQFYQTFGDYATKSEAPRMDWSLQGTSLLRVFTATPTTSYTEQVAGAREIDVVALTDDDMLMTLRVVSQTGNSIAWATGLLDDVAAQPWNYSFANAANIPTGQVSGKLACIMFIASTVPTQILFKDPVDMPTMQSTKSSCTIAWPMTGESLTLSMLTTNIATTWQKFATMFGSYPAADSPTIVKTNYEFMTRAFIATPTGGDNDMDYGVREFDLVGATPNGVIVNLKVISPFGNNATWAAGLLEQISMLPIGSYVG